MVRIWYNGNKWKNTDVKRKSNISLKEKLSNYLLEAVLQVMIAVCRGIKMENKNIAGGKLWA